MKDQRLVLEEAQIVAAPESVLTVTQAFPGSVAIAKGAAVGDVVIQEYTPDVRQTISELIETVQLVSTKTVPTLSETFSEAIERTAESGMRATDILGEKLQETQLGQAAILPGVAKYLLIAVAAIFIVGKVWK